MDINYTRRSKSIITQESNLEKFIEFKDFPVFIGCTDKPQSEDLFADMSWDICKTSGCIQLSKLLPIDLIYSGYHSEALGGVWKKHHEMFTEFIVKNTSKNILEIGGSNGALAEMICENNSEIKWTIIEPNPDKNKNFKNKNINLIKDFLNKNIPIEKGRDVIHSHVFEHTYEPNRFLEDISEYLEIGGKQIFSIPNLKSYLKMKYSNTINFEHTFYFNEEMLEYLFNKYDFKVLAKEYFLDHSIFYAVEKVSNLKKIKISNFYEENKRDYLLMVNYYKELVSKINEITKQNSQPVFLFGAHIFSQFLIYLGINQENLVSILDNSAYKEGKRLYGTKFNITKPESIRSFKKPNVIIFAGQYQDEIERQVSEIKDNAKIIGPKLFS